MAEKNAELFAKMKKIVDRNVKYYKTDFDSNEDYSDKNVINRMPPRTRMFWITREHGTNMGYAKTVGDSSTFAYYLTQDGGLKNKYYEINIDAQTVKPIRNPFKYFLDNRRILREDGALLDPAVDEDTVRLIRSEATNLEAKNVQKRKSYKLPSNSELNRRAFR